MGNVRSCTGAGACTETRTGRAGGSGVAPARSCPVPVYMTCRRMAEERGFRHPCQSRAPSSLQIGSKGRSPLAPTPLGLGGLGGAPAAPGRALAAFVPPAGPRRSPCQAAHGGEAGRPRPSRSEPLSRGPGGAVPGRGQCPGRTGSRGPLGTPGPGGGSAGGAATPAVSASPPRARLRSSRVTRSPPRWSIRTHFQSHGS
ncbi:collagen alpha-1(I) chain-like [Parus major]|uniref:collagen alpha-1(I) chain-like n=1 Tax=Parus major TaxID=9157 RepID=UPI001444180F|nr:collagen alpha-1(I) chain-like [Parus major]XP_033369184.1 collagen alpha-1(I) chain-like [Parus major]XP_033369185.1 collagen alpha-1(I) chain-like [Parus major]